MKKIRSVIGKIKAENENVEALQSLPRLVFVEDLVRLRGWTIGTIWNYSSNYPERLPRRFKLPNSDRLAWAESDVLEWLQSAQDAADKRGRGRPRKVAPAGRAGQL